MENGTYVSPPALPPHAHLSAAFQAAAAAGAGGGVNTTMSGNNSVSHFQEALMSRMGRPFGLTGSDLKDFAANSPFALSLAAAGRNIATSCAGGEGFPAASLPFLSHMAAASGQAPFLHHFVDPRHPFSAAAAAAAAGAFRPFFAASIASSVAGSTPTSSSELSKSFNSAFQPPAGSNNKMDRRGSPTLFSPGQNLFPRGSSAGSPGSPSSSPPTSITSSHNMRKIDENSNTNVIHSTNNYGNNGGNSNHNNNSHSHSSPRHDSVSPLSMDSNNPEDERAAKKIRISSSSSAEYGCCCPICGIPLRPAELENHYTQELDYLAKLSAAVLFNQKQQQQGFKSPLGSNEFGGSLFKQQQISPRGHSIEVAPRSRWDTFQRIQRNRQSRIRVKLSRRAAKRQDEILEEEFEESQHMPNHNSHNNKSPIKCLNNEEDIDIVGDESIKSHNNNNNNNTSLNSSNGSGLGNRDHVYGPPQFTEADVLACLRNVEEEKETEGKIVKKEILDENEDSEMKSADNENQQQQQQQKEEKEDEQQNESDSEKHDSCNNNNKMESLKAKLKQMEDNSKCSKCMKTLCNPVVNVGCWHIQCEKCWLLSLGSTKRCSLCGLSSVPSDLRRVFL